MATCFCVLGKGFVCGRFICFAVKATYFPCAGKVGKGAFKGGRFRFLPPLKNPLIETTRRGPAGPLAGYPPRRAPAMDFCENVHFFTAPTPALIPAGGALGSCILVGTGGGFIRRGTQVSCPPPYVAFWVLFLHRKSTSPAGETFSGIAKTVT